MYVDHVRCPACGAQFDPEAIESRNGVAACPACHGQLDVRSLFGVAAHLEEVDAPNASINDLVAGYGQEGGWRTTSAPDPLAGPGSGPTRSRPAPEAARGGTAMVPRGAGGDPPAPASGPSAVLQALRDIKKGK
jgi:hypothetical protein